MPGNLHDRPADRVVASLESHVGGLTDEEARRRHEEHGANDIVRSGGRSPADIFVAQFDSALIWVLLIAAALSIRADPTVDAILITIIDVANGIFGFVQDYRAEQSLESLRELAAPTATVRRDGKTRTIDATGLVPGDVVVLRGGDVVPADGRLLEATLLAIAVGVAVLFTFGAYLGSISKQNWIVAGIRMDSRVSSSRF